MTLNEFMKTNGLTFEDVEKELESVKATQQKEQLDKKKMALTKEFVKIVIEYMELFGKTVPEEDKEEIIRVLTFFLAPALEETAKSINMTKQVKSYDKLEPKSKTKSKTEELDEILRLLGL